MSQTKAQLIDPVDGTIVNADINASAAIAGTKISPDFGSQAISTTGGLSINGATVFNDTGANVDFRIEGDTDAALFFVDASADHIGIGKSSDIHEKLTILDASQAATSRSGGLLLQCSATSGADVGVPIAWRHQIGNGTEAQTYGLAAICGRKENATYNFDTASAKGYLQFCTTDNSGAERMRITSVGNVGIGTTSPALPLVVEGANNTTFDHVSVLSLSGTDAYNSGNAGSGILFSGKFNSSGNSTTLAQISGIKEDTGDGTYDGALTFGVRNDAEGVNIERMRIGSNGHVGINTAGTDSTYMTHIKSTSFGLLKLETTLSGADAPYLEMKHTSASPADNDQLGIIQFKGKNDANEDNTYGYLMFRSIDVSDGSEDGELQVVTQVGGVAGARLTVGQDGAIKANTGNFVVGAADRGIQFNADDSGSLEILDDYEEGVWDPEVFGFNNVQKQNTEWTGHYTKVGNLVFVEFYMRFTTDGTTTSNGGHIGVDNLPFDLDNTHRKRGFGGTNYQNINSSSHTTDNWAWYGNQGGDHAMAYVGSASVTAPNGTAQNARYIIGGFTYTAAT